MDVFAGPPQSVDTDLVIVPAFEGEASALGEWGAATGGEIDRAVESREFSAKLFETFFTPIVASASRARRLAAVGLGPRAGFTVDRARRAATAIGLVARQRKIGRIAFSAHGALESAEMIQAIAEGLTLANSMRANTKRLAMHRLRFSDPRSSSARRLDRWQPTRLAGVALSASTATWRGNSITSPATR